MPDDRDDDGTDTGQLGRRPGSRPGTGRFRDLSKPPPRPRDFDEVADQVQALYVTQRLYQENVDNRLNNGVAKMRSLEEGVEDAKAVAGEAKEAAKPQPFPLKVVLSIVIPLLLTAGGMLWKLARYPDREEYNAAQDKNESRIEAIKADTQSLRIEQVQVRGAITDLSRQQGEVAVQQDQIKAKLDTIIRKVK